MNVPAACFVLITMSGLTPAPPTQAATDSSGQTVTLIAHRGSVGQGYPENTLAAFRYAIESDMDAVEIDLRGTKDGALVVIHDPTVDRTTNGRGAVSELNLTELQKLDAGRGEHIPTFEEVLRLVAGTGVVLVIDIKDSRGLDLRQVVRLVEEHRAVPNVTLGLRTVADLHAIRALNPGIRTLGYVKTVEDVVPFADAGIDIIRLWPKWIYPNPDLINRVHALGKPVWTTAGSAPRDELEKLIALGVDGILSDLPDVMRALRADMRKPRGP